MSEVIYLKANEVCGRNDCPYTDDGTNDDCRGLNPERNTIYYCDLDGLKEINSLTTKTQY